MTTGPSLRVVQGNASGPACSTSTNTRSISLGTSSGMGQAARTSQPIRRNCRISASPSSSRGQNKNARGAQIVEYFFDAASAHGFNAPTRRQCAASPPNKIGRTTAFACHTTSNSPSRRSTLIRGVSQVCDNSPARSQSGLRAPQTTGRSRLRRVARSPWCRLRAALWQTDGPENTPFPTTC